MMDNCPDLASQHRLCCKDASLQSISLAIDELSYGDCHMYSCKVGSGEKSASHTCQCTFVPLCPQT